MLCGVPRVIYEYYGSSSNYENNEIVGYKKGKYFG